MAIATCINYRGETLKEMQRRFKIEYDIGQSDILYESYEPNKRDIG
jgi:hypothetical protein